MSALADLGNRFGVRILEDCAQSIGASFNGIATGTAGECTATSFYPTKNLGAIGDGGALLTDSAEIAATARELRDYGQRSKYQHTSIGYNSRLDELHAAILRRVLLAARYHAELRNPLITVPAVPDGAVSSWHLFPVLAPPDRKKELIAHLGSRGIATAEHYPSALPDQPALQTVRFEESARCTTARAVCSREVSLPIHPYLSDSDVARVIDACNEWL
jgi:dTDP-4-amino-4,6-dideoxygalactose transaminase